MRARFHQRCPGAVRTALTLLAVLAAAAAGISAQAPVAGRWEGAITIQAVNLRIVVNVTHEAGHLSGTIDIPQQGAAGLALTAMRSDGPSVHFELPAGPGVAVFEGKLAGDTIAGTFTQGTAAGTFSMTRSGAAGSAPAAAPAEPLPYLVEEVTFTNGVIKLAGTLTRPRIDAPVPAVVLLSGSGAQTRDEDVAGFKVFAVLADHLTRQGFAVLRTDDRGVGGSSGSVPDSTSDDFAGDALAAVGFLKTRAGIDARRIGLCGHSEGGIVAPLAASRSKDVAFIVLLAGPALTGERIMLAQAATIAKAQGIPDAAIEQNAVLQRRIFAVVRAGTGMAELRDGLRQKGLAQIAALPEAQRKAIGDPGAYVDRAINGQLRQVETTWFRFFLSHDPAPVLASVTCPVLALFGERDLQVVPLEDNRAAMKAALDKAGNRDVTITVVPEANHLFQAARTGSPAEYATLDKQFAPGMLDTLTAWLRGRTAAK